MFVSKTEQAATTMTTVPATRARAQNRIRECISECPRSEAKVDHQGEAARRRQIECLRCVTEVGSRTSAGLATRVRQLWIGAGILRGQPQVAASGRDRHRPKTSARCQRRRSVVGHRDFAHANEVAVAYLIEARLEQPAVV